jgi:hypothetical protein
MGYLNPASLRQLSRVLLVALYRQMLEALAASSDTRPSAAWPMPI